MVLVNDDHVDAWYRKPNRKRPGIPVDRYRAFSRRKMAWRCEFGHPVGSPDGPLEALREGVNDSRRYRGPARIKIFEAREMLSGHVFMIHERNEGGDGSDDER